MTMRPEAAAFLEGPALPGRFVAYHFDSQNHAGLPNFGDVGMIREARYGLCHMRGGSAIALDPGLVLKQSQRRPRDRTGKRIARVAM